MADAAELQRLAWFSPAFPVGGFAYSHGIEKAVETGDVTDADSLAGWIAAILRHGAGWNDAVLIGEAWRRSGEPDRGARERGLVELAELGAALSLARERRLETVQQGTAFHRLVRSAWPHPDLPDFTDIELPYPVAVGIAGRLHGQPLAPLMAAYLQAFAGNLIAAGIRLAVIGQQSAQVKLAALMPVVAALSDDAVSAGLDDLGGMAFRSDLMSLRHETQQVRLFRS
ncbi:MAG TPA: urease accessory protein UreF [Rhabdaerophilum sp.]|nr:urease accessory protein UreF [Rhabdaerophilum sp.]